MPTSVYNKLEEMFSTDFMWQCNIKFLQMRSTLNNVFYFTVDPRLPEYANTITSMEYEAIKESFVAIENVVVEGVELWKMIPKG